jgi:transposase
VISIDQSKKALNAFEQDSTLVVIVELSQKSWLVAGGVPGVDRHPLKKFDADENRLFALIDRWKQEAIEAERQVKRIVVTFEAGRDGFWLARWLRVRGIEAHVIHRQAFRFPESTVGRRPIALIPSFSSGRPWDGCGASQIIVGWWRSQRWSKRMRSVRTNTSISLVSAPASSIASRRHSLALEYAIFNPKLRKASERLRPLVTPEGKSLPPKTLAEMERDMQRLQFVRQQIKAIEQTRFERLKKDPNT